MYTCTQHPYSSAVSQCSAFKIALHAFLLHCIVLGNNLCTVYSVVTYSNRLILAHIVCVLDCHAPEVAARASVWQWPASEVADSRPKVTVTVGYSCRLPVTCNYCRTLLTDPANWRLTSPPIRVSSLPTVSVSLLLIYYLPLMVLVNSESWCWNHFIILWYLA